MFKNQGTSQPEASQYVNGDRHDMASEWEKKELVELDDVQLATVVGGGVHRREPRVGRSKNPPSTVELNLSFAELEAGYRG